MDEIDDDERTETGKMMKEICSKSSQFSRYLLILVLFFVQKLWWQHVWPCLQHEMKQSEVLAAVLQPVLSLVHESTTDEYENIILPTIR